MAAREEIRVPDLGDFDDVEIVEVMVAVGDEISVEDPLITLETDKAAMDVPSTAAGRIAELAVKTGDRVSEGDLILTVELASARDTAGAESPPEDAPADDAPAEPSPPAVAGGGVVTVQVPDLGDFEAAEIIEVQASVGATIAVDDPLITLETDKAAMDVPSTAAGKIVAVHVETGQSVGEGAPICDVESARGEEQAAADRGAETVSVKPDLREPEPAPAKPAPPPAAAKPAASLPPIDEKTFAQAHASPAVRKFARELGVDLARVTGTGRKNRVVKDDVKAFVKSVLSGGAPAAAGAAVLPAVPEVDFAKFGEVEIKPLTRIQKISGPRLHASWINLPHVTQNDEADITELEARRKRLKETAESQGVRLTPLAFVIKAVAIALKEYPVLNSSLAPDQENLVIKKYCNIGFAADTPNGLIVPVIVNADQKDVMRLAKELGDLSERGRAGKLKANEMQGGTFTVSSLGGIGGTTFSPIINAPEVAILGLGRSKLQPVWEDGEFVPRLIQPLSLSYDHRVVDGALGVRFTTYLASVLADVDRILLGS